MINKKYFRQPNVLANEIVPVARAIDALAKARLLVREVSRPSGFTKTHNHSVKLGDLQERIFTEQVIFVDHLQTLLALSGASYEIRNHIALRANDDINAAEFLISQGFRAVPV
jgi:hypothetical protein